MLPPKPLRPFALDVTGLLKVVELRGYGPRQPTGPTALLEEELFPYLDAL